MTHPLVEAVVSKLNANLREVWEERAAILQFCAGQPPDLAEALAFLIVLQQYPTAVHDCLIAGDAGASPSYVKS